MHFRRLLFDQELHDLESLPTTIRTQELRVRPKPECVREAEIAVLA